MTGDGWGQSLLVGQFRIVTIACYKYYHLSGLARTKQVCRRTRSERACDAPGGLWVRKWGIFASPVIDNNNPTDVKLSRITQRMNESKQSQYHNPRQR